MNTNENRPPMGSRRGGRSGRKNTNGHTQRNTQSERGQPVYSATGRTIAIRRGEVLYKELYGSKHMLQRPRGWGFDSDVLGTLASPLVIQITDRETGCIWRASVADFRRWGVAVNRGYGAQVCLPLPYWSVDGQPPKAAEARPPAAEQLSLW